MARSRQRHVQQSIRFPDKNGQNRGRRRGEKWRGKPPGRKPKVPGRPGSPHKARAPLKAHTPVHVVLRVNPEVKSMRKRHMYRALRTATITAALRELHFAESGAFRIVHISIQRTHVHMLVEADSSEALANGMKGFQISAAKHINREYSAHVGLEHRRRGNVFTDRYHREVITSPHQARHALAYVLNNWRKHGEDRGDAASRWNVDPFSTGISFFGWKEREDAELMWRPRDTYDPLVVYMPQTWLLRVGWRKHGLVGFREVPSRPSDVAFSSARPGAR